MSCDADWGLVDVSRHKASRYEERRQPMMTSQKFVGYETFYLPYASTGAHILDEDKTI